MSILWTTPIALLGLALIALPIAIHLFVRQPVRTLVYPSLRFLRETQLAAFRRRRIEDAVLLACRGAIIAAAAAAMAGPILEMSSRHAAYASRMSRAIIVSGEAADAAAFEEQEVFRSARFQRAALPDALTDAARWLAVQPRSSREVVIVGSLRRGSLVSADLDVLPADVGVRFVPSGVHGSEDLTVSVLTLRDGRLMRVDRTARLTEEATSVTGGAATPVAEDLVTIHASPRHMPLASAAFRAALGVGIPWRNFDRRAALVWPGADEFSQRSQFANAQVIRMSVPTPASTAAGLVRDALTRAAGPERIEPVPIPQQDLDAWSRRPGPPAADAPVGDDGDRRWLWALAIALLGLEAWLRRHRVEAAAPEARETEARVA